MCRSHPRRTAERVDQSQLAADGITAHGRPRRCDEHTGRDRYAAWDRVRILRRMERPEQYDPDMAPSLGVGHREADTRDASTRAGEAERDHQREWIKSRKQRASSFPVCDPLKLTSCGGGSLCTNLSTTDSITTCASAQRAIRGRSTLIGC